MATERQDGGELTYESLDDSLLGQAIENTAQRQYVAKMELRQGQMRRLSDVRRRLSEEAELAGETFYYGWGVGKDKVEGPSVKCAMAAARCWGNCSVESLPVQDAADAWIFTARFVDFETGFTLERQFRQSKRWQVYGKIDAERKDDIRFQIGQSKSSRNVVLNSVPEWLLNEAVEHAKSGVRTKLEAYIASNGIIAAARVVLAGLAKEGVSESRVFAKMGVAKIEGLTVDDIVVLRGSMRALQDGMDTAEGIFGPSDAQTPEAKKAAKTLAGEPVLPQAPIKTAPPLVEQTRHDIVQELVKDSVSAPTAQELIEQTIRRGQEQAASKPDSMIVAPVEEKSEPASDIERLPAEAMQTVFGSIERIASLAGMRVKRQKYAEDGSLHPEDLQLILDKCDARISTLDKKPNGFTSQKSPS